MVKQSETVSETDGGGAAKPLVSIGGNSGSSALVHRLSGQKRLFYVLTVLAIIGGGLLYLYWYKHRVVVVPVQTSSQITASRIEDLTKKPPAGNAPPQTKLSYYDNLVDAEATAGKYDAAIRDFNTRASISTQGLDYLDYCQLAKYYQQVGDKSAALQALDKAANTVPPDDPDNGFFSANAKQGIDRLRQEMSQ
jgi:tetratricopeptide (TPR) repeat protein